MKRKIIGVQTFWTSKSNYGQILQGYALQQFLKTNGYDAYIIRFDSILSKIKEYLTLFRKGKILTNKRLNGLRHFEDFKKLHIQYSRKKYTTYKFLQKNPPKADAYIVGSDQVWAYMRNEERRKGYLLCFGNGVKKMSYAASFGRNELENSEINTYKTALSDFSFVGVREESGKMICDNLGIHSYWVVDPVALLSQCEWTKIAEPVVISKERPSLFLYTLTDGDMNGNIYNIIDSLSGTCNFYYTNSSDKSDKRMNITPCIGEWVSYIKDCDYVVTDSFHCTLFCIIFNKNFVTIKRANGEKMNNRLLSLLTRLHLLERYCEASPDAIKKMLNTSIDWEYANCELKTWSQESAKLLLKNLEE